MNARRRPESRTTAFSMLSCVGLSLLLTLAYVGVWTWTKPGYYLFLVLATYAGLGGLALVQIARAVRMDGWTRRLGAIGVVLGFAVTIFLGLHPRTACLDVGPCLSGLAPRPLQLAFGVGIVAASLFLDRR